jgi:hypothetical protein
MTHFERQQLDQNGLVSQIGPCIFFRTASVSAMNSISEMLSAWFSGEKNSSVTGIYIA